jgi:hypothetical protein
MTKFMHYLIIGALALLTSALLLVGSLSKPSESDARKIIEAAVAKNSRGVIKLTSFTKTDGVEFQLMGMKGYELTWKGTFEVTQAKHVNTINFCVSDRPNYNKKYGAGETFEKKGTVTFQKTENGWKGSYSDGLGCFFG